MEEAALFIGGPLHAQVRAVPEDAGSYLHYPDHFTAPGTYQRTTMWREIDGVYYARKVWVHSHLASSVRLPQMLDDAIVCNWFRSGEQINKP